MQQLTVEGTREDGGHGHVWCDEDGHDAVEGQDVERDEDDEQVPEEFGCTTNKSSLSKHSRFQKLSRLVKRFVIT